LSGLVLSSSVIFQLLMAYEGQQHSWITGIYWTLSTMSTLGYGDVAFTSDFGRLFSVVILISGVVFMLVLLPFTFIEFFYAPWMAANAANRVPRTIPTDVRGHVILTFYGPVASVLIEKLKQFNYPYVVVLPELDDVLRLDDEGIRTVYGELDDPDTYRRVRVEEAAMVATTRTDIVNTSVVFTVRGITQKTPIVATARDEASIEILKLAGCSRVLNLTDLMAEALARRAVGGDRLSHVIGRIDDLVITEIDAARTSLVGKTLEQARRATGTSIVGLWARGHFEIGRPESVIEQTSVLVMAGSPNQIREFDSRCRKDTPDMSAAHVVIIGGGRVGRATALALKRRNIDYRIVEQLPDRIRDPAKFVLGSGADKAVLHEAGFGDAATVIITTNDDETNIYLTINCRLLRPDVHIISRSTLERTVAALHRAGSDFVMSYGSMGANALFNLLQRSDLLMIAEGLDVFKVRVPHQLAGKTIAEAAIRQKTGCSVIGIDLDEHTIPSPEPDAILPPEGEIVLIGTPAGEMEFLKQFPVRVESIPAETIRSETAQQ
jgi:Trk K+ transport system NAD-binding subunit